ncbi:MAG: CoA-binding protein, partial [Proteobacteria bacterium]|nr:CoA-binding protein [Pseudomonadota bacterium]
GFDGEIYPVNPRYEEILGRRCYGSLEELPDPIDLVIFCIAAHRILGEYEKAAAKGVGAAVIYDSGFAEIGGDGIELQRRIVELSRESGMALCGPNCMGVLNPLAGSSSFLMKLRDAGTIKGNVAVISQSGSICIGLIADVRRFGFSHMISSGNEAVTTAAEYLEAVIEDPATKVVAMFLEAVRDQDRFAAALDRAAELDKPVVVLKVGKTGRAQAAIANHTGGDPGDARAISKMLHAHHAIEVNDFDEMAEVIAVCQGDKLPGGPRIAVVVASGGQCELILDRTAELGLELPPLTPAVRAEAERVIGPLLGDGNPLDAWGHGEYLVNVPHALETLAASGDYDAIAYVGEGMDNQPTEYTDKAREYSEMVVNANARFDIPFYFMSMRSGVFRTDQAQMLAAGGAALIGGTAQGLGAIDKVGRNRARQKASGNIS